MLKRNRFLYLTIGGIGALGALSIVATIFQPQCKPLELAGQRASEAEDSAPYKGSVTCYSDCTVTFGQSSIPVEKAQKADEIIAAAPDTLEETDVCAQRAMAWWAAFVAWFTAIGAGLLVLTLYEAFKTNEAAKTASHAAKL